MGMVTTIGLDIAKSVFQVHGIDAAGAVLVRRRLSRARTLTALGHDVRLMPAQYVKPYVKRGKNDAADAEAICEAVTRPTMRFVAVKSPEQQSVMMLHRVRLMLNRQRTQLSNAMRAHMSEFGVIAPIGRMGLDRLLAVVADHDDLRIPAEARICLEMLAAQLDVVKVQILENDRLVRASARQTEVGRRIGLMPRQNSSGGKERLGSISRAGNRYLRQMLVVGAMAVIRHAERHGTTRPWLIQLLARRAKKVAAVALANKTARMVWVLMTSGERYRDPAVAVG